MRDFSKLGDIVEISGPGKHQVTVVSGFDFSDCKIGSEKSKLYGKIKNIKIWKRALTVDEIRTK